MQVLANNQHWYEIPASTAVMGLGPIGTADGDNGVTGTGIGTTIVISPTMVMKVWHWRW